VSVKIRTIHLLVWSVFGIAQPVSDSAMRLRIILEKNQYDLNETVFVQGELTNLSTQTMCFPEPAQDCAVPALGSLITTGAPDPNDSTDYFICEISGGGNHGRALDSEVKNKWIKLGPGEVYVTRKSKAQLRLSKPGTWKLTATYEPPEGSFSRKYTEILRAAAKKARCTLPEGVIVAEPKAITVTDAIFLVK
jgi:hypothetical protein